MDIILPNPDNKVDLLKIEEYKPKFNTSDEVKTLLNEIIGTELEIPAMIDCFYGFRMSEVIWLKWCVIEFENDTIRIDHTITQSNGKLIIRDKTKTKSSKRSLPLEPIEKSFLLELKEKEEKNKELYRDSYNQEYLEYIYADNCGNISSIVSVEVK